MVIDRNETRLCALGQLKAFLEGTGEVEFQHGGRRGALRAHPGGAPALYLLSAQAGIEEHRAPQPDSRPGYLRIDASTRAMRAG
jgi:hypothetical protein